MVTKSYQGPEAPRRCAHEAAVLRGLAGRLPVPPVIDHSDGRLRLRWDHGLKVTGPDDRNIMLAISAFMHASGKRPPHLEP